MLSCALTMSLATALNSLPSPDADGRRKTLNGHGYADTQLNATQQQFIDYSVAETTIDDGPVPSKVPAVIDVGGGYGDVTFKILERGGNVVYIDMEDQHREIVEELYERYTLEWAKNQIKGGTLTALTGRLPLASDRFVRASSLLFADLIKVKEKFAIKSIGTFSSLIYLSGEEWDRFLTWAFETLEPGGTLFLTGPSFYCNLFPGYERTYLKRLELFRKSPAEMPYPGWIPDVRAPDFVGFVPPGYFESYPSHLHLLEPEVLSYHALKKGFRLRENPNSFGRGFLRRDFPQKFIYKGSQQDVGELTSLIFEKPIETTNQSVTP